MSHHHVASPTPVPPFRHEALLYDDPAVLYGKLEKLIVPAVVAGASVLVSLAEERLSGLSEVMGRPALRGVECLASIDWAPHAARRLRDLGDRFGRSGTAGRPSLVIAEIPWRLDEPSLVTEWGRADAAANIVLAAFQAHLVCAYDTSTLPTEVISAVPATHQGPEYVAPHEHLTTDAQSPGRLVVPEHAVNLEASDAAGARQLARDWTGRAGLGSAAVDDFCLSVSEVATNALVHGRSPVCCSAWLDSSWLWYQVDDAGPGIDVLAGYSTPERSAASGRGLWLTRQLVDAVQIAPAHGGYVSSVRLGVLT